MSVGLNGNLGEFGIAEVFQLIGQQRKTGALELARDDESVQFLFDRGAVVSAAPVGSRPHAALGEMLVRCGQLTRERVDQLVRECDAGAQLLPRLALAREWISQRDLDQIEDLLTRETFFSVLRWTAGTFRFVAQDVAHSRRFGELLGAEQILMDGLRMLDEWQSLSELLPSEDVVFRHSAGFDAYAGGLDLASGPQRDEAQRVFDLIDGRLTARRVIDLSRLGSFDATRILVGLHGAGAIEPTEGATGARRPRPPRSSSARGRVRGWLGGMLPLTLLLLAAVASLNGVQPAPAEGFAIQRGALETARAAYETRRLRHALEDHRLRVGRYPAQLGELRAQASGALASSAGANYYYAPREDGAVLLAPER